MKSAIFFCLIFGLVQFSVSQIEIEIEIPADLDPVEVAECVAVGISNIPYEAEIVRDWLLDLWETVERMLEQRERCLEMTSERLQQACMATWTANAVLEANRIRRDLAVLTDEETARIFEEHFLDCFLLNSPSDVNIFEYAKLI